MNDLLKLAIEGHGGEQRWEQITRFRAAASITGAIWTLKGQPGLLGVTISTDNILKTNEFRDSVGAQWTFLSDAGRKIAKDLDIAEYTDSYYDPMIPYTLVLKPGLVIHSIYNGYWFWGRPSFEDLRRDLREVTREIRPDWDLAAPGLRANWEAGDHSMHHPYQADHGRSPSAAGSATAATIPGGA